MQPHAAAHGFFGRDALRQEATDNAAQHIAAARAGQAGIAAFIDILAAVGAAHHAAVAFEHHISAVFFSNARSGQAALGLHLCGGYAQQPPGFGRMRREHQGVARRGSGQLRMAGKQGERIGIEQQRALMRQCELVLQHAQRRFAQAQPAAAHPGADVAARLQLRRGGEHNFRPRRYHGKRQLRLIEARPHFAAAAIHRSAGRQYHRAAHALSAADHRQRAVSAFVAALAARGKQARKLLRGGLQAVEIFAAVGAGEHNDFRGRFGYNAFRRPLGVCLQFIRE